MFNRSRLKRARQNMGMNQSEVARAIKVSAPTYHYYETGERSPSVASLIKLSKALNVSIDWLTTDDEEETSTEE